MEQNGEGRVFDRLQRRETLSKANDFLKSKQLRPRGGGQGFESSLGKDQAFGMVVGFTQRARWPNDPR